MNEKIGCFLDNLKGINVINHVGSTGNRSQKVRQIIGFTSVKARFIEFGSVVLAFLRLAEVEADDHSNFVATPS